MKTVASRNRAIDQANRFRRMSPEKRRVYMSRVATRMNRDDGSAPGRFRWLERLAKTDEALKGEGR